MAETGKGNPNTIAESLPQGGGDNLEEHVSKSRSPDPVGGDESRHSADHQDEVPLPREKPPPRRILIAVDGTPGSMHTVEYALSKVVTREDQVILVNAYPDVEVMVFPYGASAAGKLMEAQEKFRRRSEQLLDTLAEPLERIKMIVTKVSLKGDGRDVVEYSVKSLEPEMLIIGSHGYGAVKRALLGSVSDYAAHHVPCPVLIVKPPPSTPPASGGKQGTPCAGCG